jgi:hypothetical protein
MPSAHLCLVKLKKKQGAENKMKVKLSLYQAVEAHMVVRRRGSHIL